MRAEANPLSPVQLATAAASLSPGQARGSAARAFELASRRLYAGMDMAQIKSSLRAEGYSDFAIQLFEPAIARLVRRGLMTSVRERPGWSRPIRSVCRWLTSETRAPRPRLAATGDLESQLHRQLKAIGQP